MTKWAKSIGANDTSFVNASGLPSPEHYSSAYDLALIAREALRNPKFAEIVRTKAKNVPWPGKKEGMGLINHNKLLWQYQGADGVKNGYTVAAGNCLVASATRNGRQLISVVLKAKNANCQYAESSAILDYGFSNLGLAAGPSRPHRRITA